MSETNKDGVLQTQEKLEEIKEFILDNDPIGSFSNKFSESLVGRMRNVEHLSLVNCNLSSLEGCPRLPNLIMLNLSGNRIDAGELILLQYFPNLQALFFGGNTVNDIEDLKPLMKIPHLTLLDLEKCKVSYQKRYRQKVLSMFPRLMILDGKDREGGSVSFNFPIAGEREEEYDEEEDDDETLSNSGEDIEDEETDWMDEEKPEKPSKKRKRSKKSQFSNDDEESI